jgi:hypothetical protein
VVVRLATTSTRRIKTVKEGISGRKIEIVCLAPAFVLAIRVMNIWRAKTFLGLENMFEVSENDTDIHARAIQTCYSEFS